MISIPDKHNRSYKNLREGVERALTEGVVRAQQAVFVERLHTYWEIGGHLRTHLDTVGAVYGEQTIKQLSSDVFQ